MDERGVGDSNFYTKHILEALSQQTKDILNSQYEGLECHCMNSGQKEDAAYVINEECMEEEEEKSKNEKKEILSFYKN